MEIVAPGSGGGWGKQFSGRRGPVLVTGISGFLGGHVATRLVAEGYEVVGLSHSQPPAPDRAALCSQVFVGDLRDREVVDQAVGEVIGVCHLAAYVPADHSDPAEASECMEVNALATLELARSAIRHGVQRFVFASAGNAYVPAGKPVDEGHQVWPVGHGAWYLTSKLAAELYIERLGRTTALSPVILRISSPYGPGATRGVVADFIARARRGEQLEVFDGGLGRADFVHARDVAFCVAAGLATGGSGTYNVGSGRATTIRELAYEVAAASGATIAPRVLPATTGSRPNFVPLNVAKAAEAWGFAPMSVAAGLRTFVALP